VLLPGWIRRNYEGYLFIALWLIGLLAFTIGPVLVSLWLTFNQYDIVRPPRFVGLGNYQRLAEDPYFAHSLGRTLYYVAGYVPLTVVVGLAISMLLNQKLKGIGWFRTLCYVPSVTPGIAVAVVFMQVFDPEFGVVNWLLRVIGVKGPGWLSDPNWSMPTLILMSTWRQVGRNVVIYLAGLQGISPSLYEAADIDGAGGLQKTLRITLPLLTPTIFFTIVMGIISAFQGIFTYVFVMTQGGPLKSTHVYIYHLYREAFQYFRMGYAATLAWILFAIVVAFTLVQFKFSRWVHYE
jgi:multiple sugar transport system permease protein